LIGFAFACLAAAAGLYVFLSFLMPLPLPKLRHERAKAQAESAKASTLSPEDVAGGYLEKRDVGQRPPQGMPPRRDAITEVLARAIEAANTARPLIESGEELRNKVWKTRLRMKQANFPWPFLPKELVEQVKVWNASVTKLTDGYLPAKEAGE